MASSVESDKRREERLRKYDRLRRERKLMNKNMQGLYLQLNLKFILMIFCHVDWLGAESAIEPHVLL